MDDPLGGTAISMTLAGFSGISDAALELKLFQMLFQLPLKAITSFVGIVLVIDTIAAGGKINAPTPQRVFWCTFEGLVAIALLLSGGLTALQAMAVSTGFPFTLVLLGACWAIVKGLLGERRELASAEFCRTGEDSPPVLVFRAESCKKIRHVILSGRPMTSFADSEKRLIAALGRIEFALDYGAAARDGSDSRSRLADGAEIEAVIGENADLKRRLSAAGEEIIRLVAANDLLVSANAALNDGLGDPDDALRAELAALKATRAAEVAALDEIMIGLETMIASAPRASDAPYAENVTPSPGEVVAFDKSEG